MENDGQLFILAGNGPYGNRGCEAIIRGTVKILREHFKNPKFVCISHFQNEQQYLEQKFCETDEAIVHLAANRINKKEAIQKGWKPSTWIHVYQHLFNPDALKDWIYEDMFSYLDRATAVLSVGGDNYAIDFGLPTLFTGLDDVVLEKGKSIFLWGSSIGPFSALPEYEQYMSRHLNNVTGIFARESSTMDYLKSINVTDNVYHVSDPAFYMDPVKPAEIDDSTPFEEDAIGINLSPLMAKYVTGGDLDCWTKIAGSIIQAVAHKTEMPIYLIPHVAIPGSNDYEFMRKALSQIDEIPKNVTLVPAYNAAETKWIISQMTLFAGARTHATIAALSSCVPTLSFAYSMKAIGINRDVFESESYLLAPQNINASNSVEKISSMITDINSIQSELKKTIPRIIKRAEYAGQCLKNLSHRD